MTRTKSDKQDATKPERYSEAALTELFEAAKAGDIEVDVALKDFDYVKNEAIRAGKSRSHTVRQMEAQLLELK